MRARTTWAPTDACKIPNAPASVPAPRTAGARALLCAQLQSLPPARLTRPKTSMDPTGAPPAASAQVPGHAPITAGARAPPAATRCCSDHNYLCERPAD